MDNRKDLIEGVDFVWEKIDDIRFKVFTEQYLLKRGYCCGNKCKNCPYSKNNKNGKNK